MFLGTIAGGGTERRRPFSLGTTNAPSPGSAADKKKPLNGAALSFEGEPPQIDLICDGTVNS